MNIGKYMSPSVSPTAESIDSGNKILQTLTIEEISQFLDIMKEKINPKHEHLSYKSGFLKLDWDSINFKNLTVDQCQRLWTEIQNHQRRHRTLTELIDDAKVWNRSTKKLKIKNKVLGLPKKPMSTYMLYFQREYQKMKAADPKSNCIVASKIIGEKFKALSPRKKSRLEKECQSSKEDYNCKLALFKEEHPDIEIDTGKGKKHNNENALTRTALKIYYDERGKEHPNSDHGKLKEEYSKLSDLEKAHYIHLAKMEFLDRVSSNSNKSQTKPNTSKEEERIYKRALGVPVKPPPNGYSLFINEFAISEEANKHSKSNEKWKAASEKWSKLTEDEKKKYSVLQKEKSLQYEKEYAAFLSKLSPEELNNFLSYEIIPMHRHLPNGNAGHEQLVDEQLVDPTSTVKTETGDEEFPKNARDFYRRKTGQKWKALEPEEKEKWTKKFDKRKRKHEKSLQNNTPAGPADIDFTLEPPLYNSTPMAPQNNLLPFGKKLKL